MPTYQYACTECGHELEAVQSFADDPLTECPACEGRLRKRYGSVGVVFKGSGFYRNDSRAAASGNGAGSKSDSSTDGGKSDGAAGDGAAGGGSKSDGSGSDGANSGATKGDRAASGGSSSDGAATRDKPAKDKTPAGTSSSTGS